MATSRLLASRRVATRRVASVALVGLFLGACGPLPGGSGALPDPVIELEAENARGEWPLVVTLTARTAELARPVTAYRWDFGAGEAIGAPTEGGARRTVVYTEAGTYTARVEVVAGAQTGEASTQIEVLPRSAPRDINNLPPTVTLEADVTEGSAPLEVTLSATAEDPNADALTTTLFFGDGTRTLASEATHVYTEPGTYVATAVVTDGRGGVAAADVVITVASP
ncbi:PKD domain-containing protein [Truepera radiovictrix]|uniref:PKD domain containing protein n=1 Tax=Truepera radiovictrix (strain DSM 17093 / CIP 108686 / LMG 22925 / RQ-24) TaxID=649638 RepID=D7CS57_TRURR|nr:PKD domain-containing protein [Truepera radiovictrix]ADI13589.1 PKD domain containing protein [Truepera radiovictrix DSM 17093]WMT57848.1 PKD domain-containing protein [Truepera radiovictrix]